MNKGTHFTGQPMYGQLISLLDKHEILKFSRERKGERYVKHFDAYQQLVVMLYAVITPKSVIRKRFLSFSNDRFGINCKMFPW